jgi:hypothetical protein
MRSSAATANGVRVVGLAEGSGRISARIARREFWEKYTLFGKRPLKTATKVALEDSVKNRRNQVSGNLARADFEERVSKKMNDEQVVQDCWKIQELMALANRCHVRM